MLASELDRMMNHIRSSRRPCVCALLTWRRDGTRIANQDGGMRHRKNCSVMDWILLSWIQVFVNLKCMGVYLMVKSSLTLIREMKMKKKNKRKTNYFPPSLAFLITTKTLHYRGTKTLCPITLETFCFFT